MVLLLALLTVTVASLSAQTAPPSVSGDQPAIKSHVRVVLVDVVVTKDKGEPVPDLRKQDFQIIEDGKPQNISFFEEHRGETPVQIALPPMPPNVFTNFPAVKTTGAINVLLMDSLNTQAKDQVMVHAQIAKYLQSVQPGTRLAIFTLGSYLRMVRGVSTDSLDLLNAYKDKNAGTGPQYSQLLPTDFQKATDKLLIDTMVMNRAAPEAIAAMRAYQAENLSRITSTRIGVTIEALQQLARYLAPFPGRKNLIWISGSFPVSFFPQSGSPYLEPGLPSEFKLALQKTADLFTADQVAVYPIDAKGVAVNNVYDPDNLGTPIRGQNNERASEQIGMETLAQDTGGKAFYNTNGLSEAMASAIDNGSHYYTLTYTPSNPKMNGEYRHIHVKLVGEKYKLSHRRGYYAEDISKEHLADEAANIDPLLPLMSFGMPDYTQILYKVSVLPLKSQPAPHAPPAGTGDLSGPTLRYSVDFAIAAPDVRLETAADGTRSGNIEVTLVAYDHLGKPVNLVTKKIPIHMEAKVYQALLQVGFQLHEEIDLPNGEVFLRTGIYDLTSSNAGTLGVPLKVVATPAAAAN